MNDNKKNTMNASILSKIQSYTKYASNSFEVDGPSEKMILSASAPTVEATDDLSIMSGQFGKFFLAKSQNGDTLLLDHFTPLRDKDNLLSVNMNGQSYRIMDANEKEIRLPSLQCQETTKININGNMVGTSPFILNTQIFYKTNDSDGLQKPLKIEIAHLDNQWKVKLGEEAYVALSRKDGAYEPLIFKGGDHKDITIDLSQLTNMDTLNPMLNPPQLGANDGYIQTIDLNKLLVQSNGNITTEGGSTVFSVGSYTVKNPNLVTPIKKGVYAVNEDSGKYITTNGATVRGKPGDNSHEVYKQGLDLAQKYTTSEKIDFKLLQGRKQLTDQILNAP